jgi:hypothetical protein
LVFFIDRPMCCVAATCCEISLRSRSLIRAHLARQCVLLPCGGDKRKQSSETERVLEYLKDYEEKSASS